jgi:branched-chain amino acid transport system ATP-binding protein
VTTLLRTRGLCAFYGPLQVLHGLDLEIERGGVTCLLGANGAGKTTVLRALTGMVRSTGAIELDGASIAGWPTEEVARLGVAHVPEGRGTFTRLTVEENLQLGGVTRSDRVAFARDLERVLSLFPALAGRRGQQAGTLSGGEQQMLAIGRALMLRPRLVLLDEPSFGLAPRIVEELFAVLLALKRDEGVSMLVVEQNAAMALKLADRAFLLETGRLVAAGSADEMGRDESVRRAYLGA